MKFERLISFFSFIYENFKFTPSYIIQTFVFDKILNSSFFWKLPHASDYFWFLFSSKKLTYELRKLYK